MSEDEKAELDRKIAQAREDSGHWNEAARLANELLRRYHQTDSPPRDE